MYHHQILEQLLASIMPACRLAFIASCCERFLPVYEVFEPAKSPVSVTLLKSALAEVWRCIDGKCEADKRLAYQKELEHGLRDSEDFPSRRDGLVQDCLIAVLDALELCNDVTIKDACSVADLSLRVVEGYLEIVNHCVDGSGRYVVIADDWLDTAPLMLAEQADQLADLEYLSRGVVAQIGLRTQSSILSL